MTEIKDKNITINLPYISPKDFVVVNLKEYMPSVDIAMFNLNNEIKLLRKQGTKLIKFICGYGSSGVGGEILKSAKKTVEKLKRNGKITDYFFGTQWSLCNKKALDIIKNMPCFGGDEDLNNGNLGVVFVVL